MSTFFYTCRILCRYHPVESLAALQGVFSPSASVLAANLDLKAAPPRNIFTVPLATHRAAKVACDQDARLPIPRLAIIVHSYSHLC
jgi:hypothetical protein